MPPIKEVCLTIGQGWAVVRELRSLTITNLESSLCVDQLPPETDLSTLTIRGTRSSLELISWERMLAPKETNQFVCSFKAQQTGAQWSEWIYVVTGIWWQAKYEMLLRGNLAAEEETISADMIGSIAFSNNTERSFMDAKIQLVGADVQREALSSESGFLMMDDDNPLSDLWKKKPRTKEMQHLYRLPRPVTIAAHESQWVRFLSALRRPAERLYQWNTADYTFTASGLGQPFRSFLVLENAEDRALPAGDAQFFWGGGRSALLRNASFSHTPPGGEIRVDLGTIDQVRGERKRVAQTDAVAGFYQESYELHINNQLPTAIFVEVLEEPPTSLEWAIVKTTVPYEMEGRQIIFRNKVEAQQNLRIGYTIRIREPTI